MLSNKLLLEWKNANISPFIKNGSKSELGNYRLVFLTAIPCKIMESIIRDKMLNKKIVHDKRPAWLYEE